jgi:diaminopimelate epimerase
MERSMTTAGSEPVTVELGKYHGLGNDFLVWLDPPAEPDGTLARRLCDRHRGVGADGLVVGRRLAPRDPRAASAVMSFRLWNADGSEAEMSGNGMRCLAHAAADAGVVVPGVAFVVSTPAGDRRVIIERRGPSTTWAEVDMGEPVVLDVDGGCNVDDGRMRVAVGNPHLVVAGPDPAGIDLASIGPRLGQADSCDPTGRNVELVALGPGVDELTMRVWERGVGETEACGTGSVAAAVAFHRWGRVGSAVTVHQPGGSVVVRLGEDGSARLAGPSERVALCQVALGARSDSRARPAGAAEVGEPRP